MSAASSHRTPAPRARALTAEQWVERSIELAHKHGLLSLVAYHGHNPRGEFQFSTPSMSQPGRYYAQTIDPQRFTVWCGCTAHEYGNPCGHVGAAIVMFRQMTVPTIVPEWKRPERETQAMNWRLETYTFDNQQFMEHATAQAFENARVWVQAATGRVEEV